MPNLRQVHLIHAQLFEELRHRGFAISPVDIGENVTTRGIDLLALPAGARLRLGAAALIEITGLRNPCQVGAVGGADDVLVQGPSLAIPCPTNPTGCQVLAGSALLQLDRFMPGLMAATLDRDADGNVIRKAGVMAIVLNGGEVRSGDDIDVDMPPHPHHPLAPV